jgi:hypothetical protein
LLVENELPIYPLVESEWECVGFLVERLKINVIICQYDNMVIHNL